MRLRSIREAAPVHDGLVIAAIFVVALLPLLSTPIFPFIDLYNHLARYFVLAHVKDSAILQQYYAANWSLLPNIGLDVIGTAMVHVIPQALMAHAVVALLFAVQYAGILYFNRALTGRTSPLVALLLVPLLYSFILNWGFANFLLGLGLLFGGAGWWLAQRHRLALALPVACLIAVVIFFTHGLCFALYGILIVALEIGLWLSKPENRVVDLVRVLVPVAIQAILPVVLFLHAPTSATPGGLTNADESIVRLADHGELATRLLSLCLYRLTTIFRVEEGPSLAFDALTLVAQIVIVGALIARRRAAIVRAAWPAIVAGVVLVIVVPPALFGVGYVADRMPLFLAMVIVGALTVDPRGGRFGRAASGMLALIVTARLMAIAAGWQGYARDYTDFQHIARLLPANSLVQDIVVGGAPRDGSDPRCLMYRPLLISGYGQIGALFADELKQPLRLTGRLRKAAAELPTGRASGETRPGYYDEFIARAGPAGFDYLLVCEPQRLTRPLPPGVAVVARTQHMTLLTLHAARS